MRYLVIHHSATAGDCSAQAVADWHVNHNGWPGIGYHYLVHPDGQIDYAGDIGTERYNVAGRNHECIGICLAGTFDKRWPTNEQLRAARGVVHAMRLFVPSAAVVGHRDIALPGYETECPGALWPQFREFVEEAP